MTPEEKERCDRIDRQLEFLASTQAHLAAQQGRLHTDLELLKDVVERHSTQIANLGTQMAELGIFVLRIGRIAEEQGRNFDRFAKGVDERLERLAEAHVRTDARLNSLIGAVERYFSDGRH